MRMKGSICVLLILCLAIAWVAYPVAEEEAREVFYMSGGQQRKGYLAIPKGPGPFPAVLYNHGGLGSTIGGAPVETARALAMAGYVGFSPIRREEIEIGGNLEDVLAAVDYICGLEQVDPDRLAILGFSRGGLLTLWAATERSGFSAVVLMAVAPGRGQLDQVLSGVHRISAPILLLVAENDKLRVDHVGLARRIHRVLEAAGRQTKLIIYPPYGQDGHQLFFQIGEYWKDILAFLRKHLGAGADE